MERGRKRYRNSVVNSPLSRAKQVESQWLTVHRKIRKRPTASQIGGLEKSRELTRARHGMVERVDKMAGVGHGHAPDSRKKKGGKGGKKRNRRGEIIGSAFFHVHPGFRMPKKEHEFFFFRLSVQEALWR